MYHTTAYLESSGGTNPEMNQKVGKGILQIEPPTLDFLNKLGGTKHTIEEIKKSPEISKKLFNTFIDHYISVKPDVTEEELAAAWRAGWKGRTSEAGKKRSEAYILNAQPKVR